MKFFFPATILLLLSTTNLAQQTASPPDPRTHIRLLQPVEEPAGGLPVMSPIPDTAAISRQMFDLAGRSFIGPMIGSYLMVQQYLVNSGNKTALEPVYIALTRHQGGFAKTGFVLLENGRKTPMPETAYVDIHANSTKGDAGSLSSVTQLYTHELGHVFYRKLSGGEDRKELSKASSIHYFPITTDYGTAFNEGFSEHIENLARRYEPDSSIHAGIFSDIRKKQQKLPLYLKGFTNDYSRPWRLSYYRSGMLLWYQQYEDLRRYQEAVDASVRFKNAVLPLSNPENSIHYRNTGVSFREGELRPPAQLMATEGFIDAFFTRLNCSTLGENYLSDSLFRLFLDPIEVFRPASQLLPPWQNQLLKNALVLHRNVDMMADERVPLHDFVRGYMALFPGERDSVLSIFHQTAGYPFPEKLPPQIWLLVKDIQHRLLVLDGFGAATIPVYTFDLNAAEVEDLLTIPGMTAQVATKMLAYRDKIGGFQSLDQVKSIPGLAPETVQKVLDARFDQAYYDSLPEPEFSISALLISPLLQLLLRTVLWFPALAALIWYATGRRREKLLRRLLRWFGQWLLLVLGGLVVALLFPDRLYLFAVLPLVMAAIAWFRFRKKPAELVSGLLTIALLSAAVVVSL